MKFPLNKLDKPTLRKKKKELKEEYNMLAETIAKAKSIISDATVRQLELKGEFKLVTALLEGGIELKDDKEPDKTNV